MNLRELAMACGKAGHAISNSQLSKIERELYRPRVGLLPALATVFQVPVDELVRESDGAR